MEAFTETNELLSNVGPKDINFRSAAIKLEERWSGEEGAKRLEEIDDYYAMGQSLTLNSVPKVIDFLAIRDYPDLYNYNGKKRLGAIFVPDSYNPVNPTMVYIDKEKLPEERTKKDLTDAVGDMAERSVYEVLKASFTHKKFKGSVLVIQGLEMLAIDPKKRHHKHGREMDFLIIHRELSCIINIEVKNSLGLLPRKKVKLQLIENHQFFEDWFGADISSKWTWVSIVYTEKPFPDELKDAFEKNEFIASGKQELKKKLLKVLSGHQINTPISDFKLICKYLLFCTPAKPLAIGLNQTKRIEEAMAKQGSVENIKVWCFPSPEQRAILNHDKVLFLAAWGTGKTLLMQTKAIELAERGEDVLFIIFQCDPFAKDSNPESEKFANFEVPSLLVLQLQLKLKAYDKITVLSMWEKDFLKLDMIGNEFKHIMIDELPGDMAILKKEYHKKLLQFIRKKQTVWVSVSGDSYASDKDFHDDMLDKISEKSFPDCNLTTVRIKIPLRSPKKVVDAMNKQMIDKSTLNRFLSTTTESPPALTQGRVTHIKVNKNWSLRECMKHCLDDVPKGASSIIIISRHSPMGECDLCKNQIIAHLFRTAFIQLKEKAPLFYTNEFCSPKEDIEDWLTQGLGRHLVISENLVSGFEHNIIINLSNTMNSFRSSGQLVFAGKTFIDLAYMALPILDCLEMVDHYECRNLSEFYLDTSLSDLSDPLDAIGKILH